MGVLALLRQLPADSLDVVYGDPDYNVGINYNGRKYTLEWEQYIDWYITLAAESLRVLKPTGNLFLINYPKQNAYLRVRYLDQHACDVHEYVWIYNTNIGMTEKHFTLAHRSILHVTKTPNNHFYPHQVKVPYQNPDDRRIRVRMEHWHAWRMPYSWFYFDLIRNVTTEKTSYPCQIPLGLFSLLLNASTCEGDDVLILFGGSGTEIMLCHKLHRNFISCELHPQYYQMILSRLSSFTDLSSSAFSSFPVDLLPDRPENETSPQLSLFTSR